MTKKKDNPHAKYASAVHRLLAENDEPIEVELNGETILVRKPDEYRHLRLLMALENGVLDDLEFSIQVARLAIPGDLSATQATRLLAMDKEGKIMDAIAGFGSIFEGFKLDESAEATGSGEADADF